MSFWKSKLSYLSIFLGFCALLMITSAVFNLISTFRINNTIDDSRAAFENAIGRLSSTPVTTIPSLTNTAPPAICPVTSDSQKFDCHPEANATETRCTQRGCCWAANPQIQPTYQNPDPVNVPQCFFPKHFNGYTVTSLQEEVDGATIRLDRQFPSGLPRDVINLVVKIQNYDFSTARITINSIAGDRWQPPLPPIVDRTTEKDVGYLIQLDQQDNKTLSVYRKLPGKLDTKLFSTQLSTLIFSDQFLQLTTSLPSSKVYGLGEMKGPMLHSVNRTRRILFNKDQPPKINRASYGAHTFMLNLDDQNQASGIFVKNSNAMDVVLTPTPAATFRSIGGIWDFFIFIGPSPTDVFRQYQSLVGYPAMIPYWSLGFHLCRYGYWSLNKTIETYERNIEAKVPLEVQWNDIDYMERFNMFTYDKINFKGLPEFVKRVHDDGRKYMMIFDPAVSGSEPLGTYEPYDLGLKMNIFVKNVTGSVVEYKVWNDLTSIFPDFSNRKTEEYWFRLFEKFHKEIDFDGAWIDMNEPSNQRNGTKLTDTCPETSLDFPPVVIGGESLFTYTACMSDRMHLGPHYDLHNLYPHLEARATYKALSKIRKGKRPFIISRASSPGQGLWSCHWTGDIDSTWEDLRQSIPDIINFAMYGMPMLGADICGFQYNTTEELCARWQALGAFYPFTRNHNDKFQQEQDPAKMGGKVLEATIKSLQKKYLLAPYLYTLMYRAHAFGDTVVRAMMFNFPEDVKTHDTDTQFMWGDGLLIAPVLEPGVKTVSPYLPRGLWYHYNDDGRQFVIANGETKNLSAPIDDINILFRGGVIVPAQDVSGDSLSGNRKNGFVLFVALDRNDSATGELFWDDGDTIGTIEKGLYSSVSFRAMYGTIMTTPSFVGYTSEPVKLRTITVFGVKNSPTKLTVNGKTLPPADHLEYKAETKVLNISGVDLDLLVSSNVVSFS